MKKQSNKVYEIWSPAFEETEIFTTYRAAKHEAAHKTVMTGKVWGIREIEKTTENNQNS